MILCIVAFLFGSGLAVLHQALLRLVEIYSDSGLARLPWAFLGEWHVLTLEESSTFFEVWHASCKVALKRRKISVQLLRNLFLLYLVLMTSVPLPFSTGAGKQVPKRTPGRNLVVSCERFLGTEPHGRQMRCLRSMRCKACGFRSASLYWRRGRRIYLGDSHFPGRNPRGA